MLVEATIADEHAWSAQMLEAAVSRPAWRVWLYRRPEIVLGCSQRALRERVAQRAPAGVTVSVRPSGGGAVLAGPWLVGLTVVLPPEHPLLGAGLTASYRWLGELHVEVMRAAGIEVRAVDPQAARAPPGEPALEPVRWACFGGLSAWEVIDADGRKLTGLAQQRRRTGVAYSGGTLVARTDWKLLCDAIGEPAAAPRLAARTIACDDVAGAARRSPIEWAQRLDAALAAALG